MKKRPAIPAALCSLIAWSCKEIGDRYSSLDELFLAATRPLDTSERERVSQELVELLSGKYSNAELAGMIARSLPNESVPRAAHVRAFLEAIGRALKGAPKGQRLPELPPGGQR